MMVSPENVILVVAVAVVAVVVSALTTWAILWRARRPPNPRAELERQRKGAAELVAILDEHKAVPISGDVAMLLHSGKIAEAVDVLRGREQP